MRHLLPAGLVLVLSACSTGDGHAAREAEELKAAEAAITAEGILKHTRQLASDEFEGRLPGTRGEDLTVEYLTGAFQALGLKPGNPDGSWVQSVPLAGYRSEAEFTLLAGGRRIPMSPGADYVAASRRFAPGVSVPPADVIFVGYGAVAPEYGWDDYKDADVRGKTIVMLINDPPVPDPADPSRLDPNLFKGRAMTYYGRWTYKFEIATEKGAAAAIIVHETEPAAYPWEVVRSSWGGESFELRRPDRNMGRVAVESWITVEKARELFRACGKDFDQLKQAAVRKDFRPVPLGAKAAFRVRNTLREVDSRNVLGLLEGGDPGRRSEFVIYTAHWDHLGRDASLEGDQIYNGALDNATGTAVLIELARAFRRLKTPPGRSILFIALTAEEQGLLGAKYYAENPLYPLERTLADINMDGVNQWGRTRDLGVVGFGNTTLDDLAVEIARQQGRTVTPETEPEKGRFYRADHFEFAKLGVPAFYPDSGSDYIGKPAGFAQRKRDEFTANVYHKVTDEVKPDWDLSGAAEDARLLFRLGYRVAEGEDWPQWKPGTEFKAKRDRMLGR
jgi:Zn-dependent M28 family amino/carboxypeptidase